MVGKSQEPRHIPYEVPGKHYLSPSDVIRVLPPSPLFSGDAAAISVLSLVRNVSKDSAYHAAAPHVCHS